MRLSKNGTKKQDLAEEIARVVGAGRPVAVETVDFSDPARPKTCLEVDFPIVPVSISGSRHVMLKGRLMTCPGDVTLTIHEPIPTAGVGRGGARQLAAEVAAVVRSAVDEPKVAL